MNAPTLQEVPPTWEQAREARTAHAKGDAHGALAWSLAEIEDLLSTAAVYDPETGAPLPRKASEVATDIARALHGPVPPVPHDALYRAAELASAALAAVLADPRHRLQRSHQTLRPERVRNVDARSMAWLARRPGHDIQEKLSSSRKMLAVVRHATEDVPANRFVRRFAADLGPRLDRVLADAGVEAADDSRVQLLRSLRDRCRLDREGSPLCNVRVAVAPTPDNVVLGDTRYARLWRAWRALATLDEITAQRWYRTDAWLSATIAWAVVATLSRAPGATIEERWTTQGGEDIGPGIEGIRVRIRGIREFRIFQVRSSPGRLEIAVERWRGDRRMILEEETPIALGCRFKTSDPATGLGHPAMLDLLEGPVEFQVHRNAIADVARQVVRSLGVEASNGPLVMLAAECAAEWSRAGIDLAGPAVDVVRDGTPLPRWVALARSTSRDGTEAWVAGESAVRWDERETGTEWGAIDLWRAAASVGLGPDEAGALRAIAESARERLGEARAAAQVAVAVPDGLDEVSLGTLRSAIGSAVGGRPWWIWRSAAAVLGWRAGGAPTLVEGDAIIVLDLAMPGFGGAALIARRAGGDGDDWSFDRPLPEPFADGGGDDDPAAILAEAIAAAQPPDGAAAPAGVIETAVSHGLAHWSANGEMLCARRDGDRWNVAAEPGAATALLARRAVAWATRFGRGTALARALERSPTKRVHLLVVGSPFGASEGATVAAALEASVPWCRQRVVVADVGGDLVARGADEFLARRARGLPTWVDLLPRLSLEVTERGAPVTIEVFPQRAVRAGESVTYLVGHPLQIPRGRRSIVLPLKRDDDGRVVEGMNAVIEHPSFPLDRDVEVRAEVQFRHAEDGFHIVLKPTGMAPFASLDVRWSRREVAPSTDASVCDEPPAWPRVAAWDEVPEDFSAHLVETVGRAVRSADCVAGAQVPVRLNAARKGEPARGLLVQDLRALNSALQSVGSEAGRVFVPGRSTMELPPSLARDLSVLEELARGNQRLITSPITEVQKAARDVSRTATTAVSRFRATTSDGYVRWMVERTADPTERHLEGERWRCVSRTIGDGAGGARARALEALTDALRGLPAPGLDPLWAASTALWGNREFVASVGPVLEAWWQGVERALGRIEGGHRGGSAGTVFDECLAILVGLLRLRGSDHGDAVSARSDRVQVVADQVGRLGRSLPASRKPRLRLAGEQPLWEATANLLRGQSMARIEMMTDEG